MSGSTRHLARFTILGVTLVVAGVSVGCKTQPATGLNAPTPPAYVELVRRHNRRIKGLRRVHAAGVVELRWTDPDGDRHFEQGDLEAWLELPHRSALNVSKFGERFLWYGSAQGRRWLFDFREGETILSCADDETDFPEGTPGRLMIDPPRLLILCGLAELPEQIASPVPDRSPPPVEWDRATDTWAVTTAVGRGWSTLRLDRSSLLPVAVTLWLDAGTRIESTIRLERYSRLVQAGVPTLGQPRFPTLVDIEQPGAGSIKLALRNPDDEVPEHLFDLDGLRGSFEPTIVEGPCR